MSEKLESVNCAVCERADTVVFSRRANAPQFVRCRHDELVYMNPRPTRDSIRQFEFVRDNNLELFDRYRRKALAREALAIKAIKPRGALLDVGCATGTLFGNFGGDWALSGVDPSPLGAERARCCYHADVFCGRLQEARYPAKSFDVVTILDTLYYSAEPLEDLRETHRVLKDDGLLAIEVPGFTHSLLRERRPLCWLLDRRWSRGFSGSHHFYYFARANLSLLLRRAGFRIIRRIPEPASRSGSVSRGILNTAHFALARILWGATAGRFSIAAKELYLAVKEA